MAESKSAALPLGYAPPENIVPEARGNAGVPRSPETRARLQPPTITLRDLALRHLKPAASKRVQYLAKTLKDFGGFSLGRTASESGWHVAPYLVGVRHRSLKPALATIEQSVRAPELRAIEGFTMRLLEEWEATKSRVATAAI